MRSGQITHRIKIGRLKFLTTTFCTTFLALVIAAPAMAELQVGDAAPDFNLPGSDGNHYTLGQFKGKKPVVIAFFPKAFTGG